ncbi:MAG: NAD(P)/FAD-dependent oxidoreductase [Sulfolobales archaeon]
MAKYDAIVIGAGHNGLVAACNLAMRGLRVAVFERNRFLGGMASSPELWPGFAVPIGAYVISLFRREIAEELGLFERGLRIIPKDPGMTVFLEGGKVLSIWSDPSKTAKEISRISERDAAQYARWSKFWGFVGALLDVIYMSKPLSLEDTLELAKKTVSIAKHGGEEISRYVNDIPWIISAPASKILDEYFETEEVKAALVEDALVGEMISPSTPGSSIVMAHHYMGNITGNRGQWGYVEGGMGSLSKILAKRCSELGVEIHLGVEVERIVVSNAGWVRGVIAGGKFYESWMVLSSADVRTTMLKLLDPEAPIDKDLIRRIKSLRSVGASSKIVVAMRNLPKLVDKYSGYEDLAYRSSAVTIPSIDYVEKAYSEALMEGMSRNPWVSVNVQSYLDRTVAPEGWHIASLFVQYTSRKSPGNWGEEDREKLVERVFTVLENYYSGFRKNAEKIMIITPRDIEEMFQTPGGNIFHISMSPDQLWSNRPDRELSNYRTPVKGLYLCGADTHPGGGVSGVPGYLCSTEALIDAGIVRKKFKYHEILRLVKGILSLRSS